MEVMREKKNGGRSGEFQVYEYRNKHVREKETIAIYQIQKQRSGKFKKKMT